MMSDVLDDACLEKLRGIFVRILGNTFPRDDTFIEKLVTLCSSVTSTQEQHNLFVEKTEVLNVLKEASVMELAPEAYAFLIRIFTVIAQHGYLQTTFQAHADLFNKINDAQHRSEASVRYAWTMSCMTLCKQETFLSMLLAQKGFFSTLKMLCEDPSLFVSEKAHKFVGVLLLRMSEIPACKPDMEKLMTLIVLEPLRMPSNAFNAVSVLKFMVQEDASCAGPIIQEHITLLLQVDLMKSFPTRKAWMEVFNILAQKCTLTEDQLEMICKLPHELQQQQHEDIAIDLASWILTRFPTSDGMEDLIKQPLQQFSTGESSPRQHLLIKAVNASKQLKSQDKAMKLVLQVLEADLKKREAINRKLLGACLITLQELIPQVDSELVITLLRAGVQLLTELNMPFMVVSKTLEVIIVCLDHLCQFSAVLPEDLLTSLSSAVNRKLCDMMWEVRDSAIEFVGKLVQGEKKGWPQLVEWLKGADLIVNVSHSCVDKNSYVRASALSTLAYVMDIPSLWNTLGTEKTEKLIKLAIDTALTDEEAFPRRTSVHFLSQLVKNDLHPAAEIHKVMVTMGHDFDWEVKLAALEFWRGQIEDLDVKNAMNVNGNCGTVGIGTELDGVKMKNPEGGDASMRINSEGKEQNGLNESHVNPKESLNTSQVGNNGDNEMEVDSKENVNTSEEKDHGDAAMEIDIDIDNINGKKTEKLQEPKDGNESKTLKRKSPNEGTYQNLVKLISMGGNDFLQATLVDEDRSVELATCKLLQSLKERLLVDMKGKKAKLCVDSPENDAEKISAESDVECNQLNAKKPKLGFVLPENEVEKNSAECNVKYSEFRQWLLAQDLDEIEKQASQSIDQYADNPLSFLNDVLGSFCKKADVCDDTDGDQAAAVDCY